VRQAGAGFTAGMQSYAALRFGEADGPPHPWQGMSGNKQILGQARPQASFLEKGLFFNSMQRCP
jgi:hypothetical protein